MNANIFWALVCCSIWGFADSLWTGTVLAAYLYVLTDDTSYVGYVEAMIGLVGLMTALPVGYYADKVGRYSS